MEAQMVVKTGVMRAALLVYKKVERKAGSLALSTEHSLVVQMVAQWVY